MTIRLLLSTSVMAEGSTTVTWTATDACGNVATTSSTITVTPDNTPPAMSAPANLTLPCSDLETTTSSISSWLASVTATDDCGGLGSADECPNDCIEEFSPFTASDLGLSTGNNQSVTNVDVSCLYGLPPGSILISASNINVNAVGNFFVNQGETPAFNITGCLLYTSPSPRDQRGSRMPSSA